jgi:hypothetical protein
MAQDIDRVLEKLARDVESAVHALYRGETRQATARARTDHLVGDAKAALTAMAGGESAPPPHGPSDVAPISVSPRPGASAPSTAGAAVGWTNDDSDAVLRCINAWLPVSGPASTAPDTKCIAAGKMLIPTWGERERARAAVRRIT